MKRLIDVSSDEAKKHFLKESSYFNGDFPNYITFGPILNDVANVLGNRSYLDFKKQNPDWFPNVNYNFISNKDGRFSWRPFELMHPALYVSLVNLICEPENWARISLRLKEFEGGAVECCSSPVMSINTQSDQAAQVRNWWQRVEQRSLTYSLEFSHLLHTDVIDCYGFTFPAIAGILSHLISLAPKNEKIRLWSKVHNKMKRVPYNGYLEIWLQRVTKPKSVGISFESDEPICQVVNGKMPVLWENAWIANNGLKAALEVSKIVVSSASEEQEVITPEEVALFNDNAWAY